MNILSKTTIFFASNHIFNHLFNHLFNREKFDGWIAVQIAPADSGLMVRNRPCRQPTKMQFLQYRATSIHRTLF